MSDAWTAEQVTVLFPEHRDRQWRDRYGFIWQWTKWADGTKDWGMRDTAAVPWQRCSLVAGDNHYRAPFTEVGPYVFDVPRPTVEATRYQVTCLPSDHVDAPHFSLYVERRSANPDRWAVSDGAFNYDQDGRREYESIPSSRTDEFKREFRFDLDTALNIARRIAPTLQVNGHTVESVLRRGEDE